VYKMVPLYLQFQTTVCYLHATYLRRDTIYL